MATRTTESWDMIERWKADHPELADRAPTAPAPKPPRPRLVPAPTLPAARTSREDQQAMIERWRREHPELTGLARPTAPAPAARVAPSPSESDRRVIDIANTPLTVLSAFIIGCLIGGIAMVIVTGIAFWGFSGG